MATVPLNLLPAVVNVDYYQYDGRTITLNFGTLDVTDPARTWEAQVRPFPWTPDGAVLGEFEATPNGPNQIVLSVDDDIAALVGVYSWAVHWQIGAERPVTLIAGRWSSTGDLLAP